MIETPLRSAVKALSWRVIATLTTMSLVYAFTRRLTLALGVGALEVVCKLVFYYAHERAWNHTRWGKLEAEEVPGEAPVPSEMADRRIESAELSPGLAEDP